MRWQVAVVLSALTFGAAACGPEGHDECVVGARGCACSPLGTCSGKLVCHDQVCVRGNRASLEVRGAGARACELVVRESQSELAAVQFEPGARGQTARRGDRTSIAVISESDTDLAGDRVVLRWLGNTDRPSLTVEQSACFDRTGSPIAGSSVRIR